MKEPSTLAYILLIFFGLAMAVVGLYLMTIFNRLFKDSIRNELLRKNVAAWVIIFCMTIAMQPMSGSFFVMLAKYNWWTAVGIILASTTITTLFVYNTARAIAESPRLQKHSFIKHKSLILLSLILTTMAINIPSNYFLFEKSARYIKFAILNSIYLAGATGLVYAAISYIASERKRKFDEKELELSRMRELKSKAELEALHSKVNPHFLYNALNSIADLSITDGKKGRKMTIALADLFRYSINYNDNNFSTVKDEIEMAEVYLQIEKIRFEDNLNYSISIEDGTGQYLLPRFLLQPLVENAVKHGLKATGKLTEINLQVQKKNNDLFIHIKDNGPAFPEELNPGYGVRSVFDKLDLLFPDNYEIYFSNDPEKRVSIVIKKLRKDESVI